MPSSTEFWLDRLGYTATGDAILTSIEQVGRRPYANELQELLDPTGDFGCDAVFVVENTPTICFVNSKRAAKRSDVDAVRQRLWNQNLASALLVCDDGRLEAFAISKSKDGEAPAEALRAPEARSDGKWSASEIQSSEIQQRLSDWFDPNRRVDRQLLRQLDAAVRSLTEGRAPLLSDRDQAKMLLAQVLFISYLEHRGIAGDEYRDVHKVRKLHDLVTEFDGAGIDRLIARLKDDFNGDFLEPKDIRWEGLDRGVLDIVAAFLARVDLGTGQKDFWNYDFSHIPVELLSGIYEVFLDDTKHNDGAYYTPRVLAELAIDQAFDGLEKLSELRILDGACGSGILLTTAFRRIVTWEEADRRSNLSITERIELLKRTIFGGDINPIACRVTAFSLYLCLLERLAPSDLTLLQRDENCKLPKLIGRNITQGDQKGDFFSDDNPFASGNAFDLIISNPPWLELGDGQGENAKAWAARTSTYLPHQQIAAAYAMKSREAVKLGGRIVLILPTSLITAPTNDKFVKQLTIRTSIERMTNLADFRRILFAEASHACTIVRTRNIPAYRDGMVSGTFDYWIPKVDISFAFNRLTLHDYDRVTVPRVELTSGNARLRRMFWGSRRDESLYNRLCEFPTIDDIAKERGWVIAKGYHMRDRDKRADPTELARFRFLDTRVLNTPSPVVDLTRLIEIPLDRGVASVGNLALYEGERVVLPDGTSVEMEIRAAYANEPFCFNSAVGAIRVRDDEPNIAKLLTLYFRSNVAKYYLILNSYTAQTERARVTLRDLRSLPFPRFESSGLSKAAEHADRLLASLAANAANLFDQSVDDVTDQIDDVFFDLFGLSDNERILVRDMTDHTASSLQPTSYSELFTPLQKQPGKAVIAAYRRRLETTLQAWSHSLSGKGSISARIVDRNGDRTPLDVIHVSLATDGDSEALAAHGNTARDIISAIASQIEDGRPIDFFSMPNSIFVWGNNIYVIKPRRMRFWTESSALSDADEILKLISTAPPAAGVH